MIDTYYFVESLEELFVRVQTEKIFPDSKFFVDCTPRTAVASIVEEYNKLKDEPGFDLNVFLPAHFIFPAEIPSNYLSANKPILQHLEDLWTVLKRTPSTQAGSIVPLPFPYIVPGGRFREIFYWDSYFTMLGLQVSKQPDLIESMLENFAFLIDTIGYIPNGNRTYFLSRSQPPFFALMLEILAAEKGEEIMLKYLPQLEKEYDFWMDGGSELSQPGESFKRVVMMPDGSILNRYWDEKDSARAEAFKEDSTVALNSGRDKQEVQRHLRAACESGWDFSSRWQRDGQTQATIETTHIVPVDLNCLILFMEETLAKQYTISKQQEKLLAMQAKINSRITAIQQYCRTSADDFYCDYHFVDGKPTNKRTLAAVFPLYFRIASPEQAKQVADIIQSDFLCDGGVVTTLVNTGQQWDAPNGWAPLQWMTYKAMKEYGFNELAATIRERWTKNCEKVYADTGKMMEKYNVQDIATKAGGGKYPNQDGFGWTNGVYIRMKIDEPVSQNLGIK